MLRNRLRAISPGVAFAVAAPVLYGIHIPLSKIFLEWQVGIWMLVGLLYLSSGLGLAVVYLTLRGLGHSPAAANKLHGRDWVWIGLSTLAGGVIGPLLLMLGLTSNAATSASLLLSWEGVFTALIAWLIFHERFHWRVACGLAAITAGSVILAWNREASLAASWGALAVVGACLSWAIASNCIQQLSARDPLQVVTLEHCVAGGFNTLLALLLGDALPAAPTLMAVAVTGFVCEGLTFICFILALRYIGTSRTGTYFSLAPFVGAAGAVVLLGEPVTSQLLTAAGFIALGIWFCLSETTQAVVNKCP